MPSAPAHVVNVPVNQIREITQAAWATPDAIVLSIGEPGFPVARHVLEAGMAFHVILGMWMDDWGYETSEPVVLAEGGPERLTTVQCHRLRVILIFPSDQPQRP